MIVLILLVSALLFLEVLTQYKIENPEMFGDDCNSTQNPTQCMFFNAFWRDFGSVGKAMMVLFQSTTGGRNWYDIDYVLGSTGPFAKIMVTAYVTFFMFAFLNIITSIFVDRVMRIAQPNHDEQMMAKRMQDREAAEELKDLILSLNTDADASTISEEELTALNENIEVRDSFELAGLNILDVHGFFNTLCRISGSSKLEVDTFVEYAFRMKGLASSLDVQTILLQCDSMSRQLHKLTAHHGLHHHHNDHHHRAAPLTSQSAAGGRPDSASAQMSSKGEGDTVEPEEVSI